MNPNFTHKDLCLGCPECTNEEYYPQWVDCTHYFTDENGKCRMCDQETKKDEA